MRSPRLALPWYVHPVEAPREWDWLAGQEVSFAVLNVHNGPGEDDDAYYPAAVAGLGQTRVLGYVPVDYGRRPVAEVAEEVRAWQRFYGVQGILLDELPASGQSLRQCARYAAAARAAGAVFLAANPGIFPTSGHVRLFDVVCVFEGTADAYADYLHPEWARSIPPSRLWHLVHSCDPEQLARLRLAAGHRGAGHVFVTDRTMPNPWLGPPTAVSAGLAARDPARP